MKKSKKVIALSMLGVLGGLAGLTVVNAATATINTTVPAFQGYRYTNAVSKSQQSGDATVNLTKLVNDAVTFSAGSATSNNYGDGVVVKQTGRDYTLNYPDIYGAGQSVKARFRNHNWTNNAGAIKGTVDFH